MYTLDPIFAINWEYERNAIKNNNEIHHKYLQKSSRNFFQIKWVTPTTLFLLRFYFFSLSIDIERFFNKFCFTILPQV